MMLAEGLVGSGEPFWVLGFAFLIAHAIADFSLQSEFLALGKNHRSDHSFQGLEGTRGIWFHCLTAHSLVHAGAVWIVSGNVYLGLIEFGLHWFIDFIKSERWTNFHVDQLLHVLCKAGYVAAIYYSAPAVAG
ncbi:MAG: DUF3307 domain-containing protein [Verrucomicrobiota bacterium]